MGGPPLAFSTLSLYIPLLCSSFCPVCLGLLHTWRRRRIRWPETRAQSRWLSVRFLYPSRTRSVQESAIKPCQRLMWIILQHGTHFSLMRMYMALQSTLRYSRLPIRLPSYWHLYGQVSCLDATNYQTSSRTFFNMRGNLNFLLEHTFLLSRLRSMSKSIQLKKPSH